MRLIDADALIDEVMERYCEDCNKRKGLKNGKWRVLYSVGEAPCRACGIDDMMDELDSAPTIDAVPDAQCERIVKLINDLIDNAVHHGADCGGAYFTNEEGLIESARNLLNALNLNGRYAVKKLPGWHDSWSDIAVTAESE